MIIQDTKMVQVRENISPTLLSQLAKEVAKGSDLEPVHECLDCDEDEPCLDCEKPRSTDVIQKSTVENPSDTTYSFNLVLPGKGEQVDPQAKKAEERQRLIYIGLGLIAVFLILFIVMKATSKKGG